MTGTFVKKLVQRFFVALLAFSLSPLTLANPAHAKKHVHGRKHPPKKRRKHPRKVCHVPAPKPHRIAPSQSKYAALVMDARTKKILYSVNPDSLRHPASLTKIAALYLAFDALKKGLISPQATFVVSANAAKQPPSKLNLKTGERISLETLIMSMATVSSNDATVTLAEGLAGSEENFARLMTQKVRQLGLQHTTFKNASGLPNRGNKTTARDMATLAIAMQRDFPKEYWRFGTKTFHFRGRTITNHNHLLGKVWGVNGLKTGFTNASGFNLSTSAVRGNNRLIVIVLGGPTRHWRDRHVEDLIEKHCPASAH